ncbi:hypothetical protein [Streptomyces tubercidicus]|uniref:hypothetical protein n=1 Tax=Streptomyces tubercidicus TaxID=47759 RepID=UPI0036B879A1
MSTTHHHTPRGDIAPYEGEYVWAELVDDEEPGPHDEDQEQPPGAHDRRRPARAVGRAAATVLRAIAGHTGPGLRHAWAATSHWTTLGYMSDEEIRRRLVKRHLDTYIEHREDITADINRLGKKAQKLTRDAVAWGLTAEEGRRLKDVGTELKLRRTAGQALTKIPFDVAGAQPTGDQVRRYRSVRALGRFVGVLLPAGAATLGVVLAAPLAGLVAVPVLAGAAWWLGRHPLALTQRALPAELVGPRELEPLPKAAKDAADDDAALTEELKPYPIAEASSPDEAAEALRRAILAEGGDVDSVTGAVKEPWGWSAYARFASGSPDDLNKDATYKGIVTLLNLRRDGLLVEGDPEAGAACTVRMVMRNPFTPDLVGTVPYRAPLSTSILDTEDYGVAMDATPLVFSLAGLMLLMVADSGGGKSGIMLAMAETVTSTRDAVAINLDPVGTGAGALGPALTLSACMDDDTICAVLQFFLDLCSARARQRARYGWGNKWRVSPEHPAFCIFVDEWPQLSTAAKALLIRLLLLGRKEAIWVFGGSQFGTKDYLGEAIGPKLSAKLLGACRRVDVTELMGGGALGEGYRADLIRAATHTSRNDAGQIYATGLPGMPDRPKRYQVREITDDYAAQVGAERARAGLPDVIRTLTEAGMLEAWKELTTLCVGDTYLPPPQILTTLREIFAREDDPEALAVDQIHTHLKATDPETWGAWDDRPDRLAMVGRALKKLLAEHDITLPTTRLPHIEGKPTAYRLQDITEALTAFA